MPLALITPEDLEQFKQQLIRELRELFKPEPAAMAKPLKSNDVCRILRISPGTLQNLRKTKRLCFRKVGGTIYYRREDIERLI